MCIRDRQRSENDRVRRDRSVGGSLVELHETLAAAPGTRHSAGLPCDERQAHVGGTGSARTIEQRDQIGRSFQLVGERARRIGERVPIRIAGLDGVEKLSLIHIFYAHVAMLVMHKVIEQAVAHPLP